MTWLQTDEPTAEVQDVKALAEELRATLDSDKIRTAMAAIAPIGGTSHEVDVAVQPYATALGFTSQRTTLFAEYPLALRPDWYLQVGQSGVLLEIERGKTVTNNMDLLDLWKCHICREAHHLFLVVPVAVTRSYGSERVYPRVVTRLQTFFVAGNETNVRSAAIFGY
jgi:hypothetical protein